MYVLSFLFEYENKFTYLKYKVLEKPSSNTYLIHFASLYDLIISKRIDFVSLYVSRIDS